MVDRDRGEVALVDADQRRPDRQSTLELGRAVAAGADLVGVNQRDLVTFRVDTARAVRMAPQMPAGVVRVAESGITGPVDSAVLAEAGYHAVLVGEHLVTAGDAVAVVAALRASARS